MTGKDSETTATQSSVSGGRHLVLAGLWADQACDEEIGEYLRRFKVPGSRGAVVTFLPPQTEAYDFQRTLHQLHLEELNDRPISTTSNAAQGVAPTDSDPPAVVDTDTGQGTP